MGINDPEVRAKAAEAAAKKREARMAAGLSARMTPIEKLAEKATPMRAIAAKCYDCQGQDADPGVRWRIGNCEITDCPLHGYRPYRQLFGEPMPKVLQGAELPE